MYNIIKMTLNPRSTSSELMHLAKKMNLSNLHICMRKNIIKIPSKSTNVIINLADDPRNGTHWVALRIEPDKLIYFDSFGLIPPQEVVQLANFSKKSLIYNQLQYQKITLGHCGEYSLLALWCLENNIPLQKYLKPFRKFNF